MEGLFFNNLVTVISCLPLHVVFEQSENIGPVSYF